MNYTVPNTLYVESVGIIAPGIEDWNGFDEVLAGTRTLDLDGKVDPKPTVLPASIRRRASRHIRLAVAVAEQTLAKSAFSGGELPAIFASSENDGSTVDEICMTVVGPEPMVSPTRFHNSVNNAAVGNWSIALGLTLATTSVLSFDGPAATGLVEAAGQLAVDSEQVLLVVHDTQPPPRLQRIRPFIASFATAFVLTRFATSKTQASLSLEIESDARSLTNMVSADLEVLRRGNPAATALPLLSALAKAEDTSVLLPYVDGCQLKIQVRRC